AIAPFGALLSITEWWENGDPPGSFRLNIDVTHAALTEATYQEMERMIALAKPVSRHLKALRLTYIAKGEVFTGAVSHSGDIIQVYPDATLPNPCITGGEIYCAGAIYDSDITRVKPDTEIPSPCAAQAAICIAGTTYDGTTTIVKPAPEEP
ncbi:phage tail protein I, partial [Escherichia coli]|nr:phage tail protein I [Escherichia coli]EMC1816066.1 phage tail protein I [Escherichia coli]